MLPRRAARRTARRTARRVGRRENMLYDTASEPANDSSSSTDELERLFALKEEGAITEEEYQQKKNELF